MPAAEYKVVVPPQLRQGPDPITTDVNVAYAILHPNVAHASTNFNAHELYPVNLPPSRHV